MRLVRFSPVVVRPLVRNTHVPITLARQPKRMLTTEVCSPFHLHLNHSHHTKERYCSIWYIFSSHKTSIVYSSICRRVFISGWLVHFQSTLPLPDCSLSSLCSLLLLFSLPLFALIIINYCPTFQRYVQSMPCKRNVLGKILQIVLRKLWTLLNGYHQIKE